MYSLLTNLKKKIPTLINNQIREMGSKRRPKKFKGKLFYYDREMKRLSKDKVK
jgi:hypothetical protein